MSRAASRRPGSPIVLGTVLALASLNLRAPVTAVGPVLDDIRHGLRLSGTQAGLLTMAPLLCFGLVAPLAPRLIRRHAPEAVVFVALVALAAGVLVRVPASVVGLFAGTIVLGAAIAVANVLVPVVIKRDFPRPGTMMGVYSMALGAAGALGAGLSVPLERGLGDSWRWGLAVWAVPAVGAAALLLPAAWRAHRAPMAEPAARVSLWRDRRAWTVSAYMGCQALLFYAFAAWLPDILKVHGVSDGAAGSLTALEMLVGVPVSLAVPVIAERLRDQRALACMAAGLWLGGVLGLLLAPGTATIVWVLLIGFGQGAGISLVFACFVLRSPDGRRAASLSGMAQTVGYVVAAMGPLAVGALHDASGGWTAPLVLLLAVAILMLLFGLDCGRPGFVRGRELQPGEPAGAELPATAVP